MTNLYFRNTFVSIYYDRALYVGKAVWAGDLVGSEFREAVLLCLDMIERHQLVGWLGDNRKMKTIQPADQVWSVNVFIPQLLNSPLQRLAHLPSRYEQNRQSVASIYHKRNGLGEQLEVRDFSAEEEAVDWLLELNA
ncbi:hypothetical protein [Pontibacter sp. SGAir0037]|uniref:hypothetical protein n=1 Tax=Pontibacter sp. SGAir0037 TaxID=2571030 RepID=UPI0010CCB4C1|nr:hypothetical protein [Pontibacter sp. SGAir0037]QCR23923.1 hypothetical protein C1N53_17250 [Pontibacter sp. SGAir0037]